MTKTYEFWKKVHGGGKFTMKMLTFILIIGATLIVTRLFNDTTFVAILLERIEALGFWAPVIFIGVFVLISGILVSSIVLKIFAGTLFGVLGAVVYVTIATTISAWVKFLLARYFFRERVLGKINKSPKLKALDQVIEEKGWKVLILLKNIPIVSAMFLSYICGVTKMRTKDFVWASLVGKLPTTVLYAYIGYVFGYTVDIEKKAAENLRFEWVTLGIGLLATLGLCWYVYHLSKKVLIKKAPSFYPLH